MQRIELHSRIMEAVKLGDWVKQDDIQFCIEIAKVYGCKPLKTDIWNFFKFLFALYGYGKVQGKHNCKVCCVWRVYVFIPDSSFLPNGGAASIQVCNPSEIPLGELASFLKIMDRVAHRQNLAPHKIAENFKKVSAQFGVELTEDFVKVPEYEQLTLESLGK